MKIMWLVCAMATLTACGSNKSDEVSTIKLNALVEEIVIDSLDSNPVHANPEMRHRIQLAYKPLNPTVRLDSDGYKRGRFTSNKIINSTVKRGQWYKFTFERKQWYSGRDMVFDNWPVIAAEPADK